MEAVMPEQWNPRYVSYAAAHGRSPEHQLARDKGRWSGASMLPFMMWIADAWRRWGQVLGAPKNLRGSELILVWYDMDSAANKGTLSGLDPHKVFTEWLDAHRDEIKPRDMI